MRMIEVSCPGCGRELEADPSLAGTFVECPLCSQRFRIPKTPTFFADDPDKTDGKPKRKRKSSGPKGRKTGGKPGKPSRSGSVTECATKAPRGRPGTKSARRTTRGNGQSAPSKNYNGSGLGCLCQIAAFILVAIVVTACGIDADAKQLLPIVGFVGLVIFELVSKNRK